jgi:hypothetical protein
MVALAPHADLARLVDWMRDDRLQQAVDAIEPGAIDPVERLAMLWPDREKVQPLAALVGTRLTDAVSCLD